MSQAQQPLQFIQVIIGLTMLVLAWPVTVTCSAPFQTCTPPPNEKGEIIRPITIEPYAVVLLEKWLHTDFDISYKTDTAIDRPVVLSELTTATDSAIKKHSESIVTPEVENSVDELEK